MAAEVQELNREQKRIYENYKQCKECCELLEIRNNEVEQKIRTKRERTEQLSKTLLESGKVTFSDLPSNKREAD